MTEEHPDDNDSTRKPGFGVPGSDVRSGHGQLPKATGAAHGEPGTTSPERKLEAGHIANTTGLDSGTVEAEITQILAQLVGLTGEQTREYWEGPLPSPQDFAKYTPEVQQKLLAWNDAKILDESQRLTRVVEAEIRHSNMVTRWGVLFTLVFTALAGVAGLGQGNLPLAALFLGVPAMSIIATFINSARPPKRGKTR